MRDTVYTEQHKGCRIEINYDPGAGCPWTDWDGEPPLLALCDRHFTEYGLTLCLPDLTDAQVRANGAAIMRELGHRPSRAHTLTDAVEPWNYYGSVPDAARDALRDHFDGLSSSDKLELLATVHGWLGIPALCTARCGYSQGDYVELLLVATPQWQAATGCTAEQAPAALKAAADLYADWVFGNCWYWHIEGPDGETDSCGGYYGRDDNYGGALVDARAAAEYMARDAAERARETVATERAACLRLLRQARPWRKRATDAPDLCRALQAAVQGHLARIAEARAVLAAAGGGA